MLNTSFRDPGGLSAHLKRTDTNEMVVLREDLCASCVLSIDDAIADFAAIGAAAGAKNPLVHISFSPAFPLSLEQERQAIALIARVYGIPDDHPLFVVMHAKPGVTDRPAHYHLVLPRVKADGRVIKDSHFKLKNERLTLELKWNFGHPLVPGPNVASVRKTLQIERPDMADAIEDLTPPPKSNDQTTVTDKNFANRHGTDLPEFDARVLSAWQAGAFSNGREALAPFKVTIAKGDRAVMVVDTTTGLAQSLQRVVNRESKRKGFPLALKQRDVEAAISAPPEPMSAVRTTTISASVDRLRSARREASVVEAVIGSGPPSAAVDGQTEAAGAKADSGAVSALKTQKQQLAAINLWRRELLDSRKRAAEKAWREALVWRGRDLKSFVFWAGAGAAFACGGGLLLSISVGIFARTYVVTKARTRFREARIASATLKRTRVETKQAVDAHFALVRSARAFNLKEIPREAKAAAGHIFVEISNGREPRQDVVVTLERITPDLSNRISAVARFSTSPNLRAVLAKMCPADERHRTRALDAFVHGRARRQVERVMAAQRGRDGWSR